MDSNIGNNINPPTSAPDPQPHQPRTVQSTQNQTFTPQHASNQPLQPQSTTPPQTHPTNQPQPSAPSPVTTPAPHPEPAHTAQTGSRPQVASKLFGQRPSSHGRSNSQQNVNLSQTQPPTQPAAHGANSDVPQGVVRVYSSNGLEYLFFAISLIVMVAGVVMSLSDLIAEFTSDVDYTSPFASTYTATTALAGAALTLYYWLRLRKVEQANHLVVSDPSRRRGLQFGLKVGFLTILGYFAFIVWTLINQIMGGESEHFMTSLLQGLIGGGVVTLAFIWVRMVERKGF